MQLITFALGEVVFHPWSLVGWLVSCVLAAVWVGVSVGVIWRLYFWVLRLLRRK